MRNVLIGFLLLAGCSEPASDAPEGGSTTAGASSEDGGTAEETSGSSSTGGATTGADGSSTGEEPPEGEPWTVGTRLQPILERDADGNERLVRWFDPQLGVDCVFAETTEGVACRPLAYWSPGTFADSGCSEPATPTSSCGEVSAYGNTFEPGCGPPTPVRRGEALDVVYTRDAEGACVESTAEGGYRIEPLPFSELVGAARSLIPVDDALGHWEYVGDDGSSQWVGPTVLELETDDSCLPIEVDGAFACATYPFASASSTLHVGSDCRGQEVAAWYGYRSCPEPRFVNDGGSGFGTITGLLDAEAISELNGDTCEPFEEQPDSQWRYYSFRPFELSDGPALEVERVGSGRLRLQQPQTLGGDPLGVGSYEWFDTELDTPCVVEPSTSRCAPSTRSFVVGYADSACTQALVPEAPTSRAWLSLWDYSEACSASLLGAIRLGDTRTGDIYTLDDSEGCVSASTSSTLREIAELVPAEDLAVLEEVRP